MRSAFPPYGSTALKAEHLGLGGQVNEGGAGADPHARGQFVLTDEPGLGAGFAHQDPGLFFHQNLQ